MHVVIYKFTPKLGSEAEFVESWKKVTEGIYEHRGSLGSRLHNDSNGNWIAYAQWPSKEIFSRKVETPEEHKYWLTKMLDSLEKTEVLFEMNVVEDLLKRQPAE
jgi:hypothetical protein